MSWASIAAKVPAPAPAPAPAPIVRAEEVPGGEEEEDSQVSAVRRQVEYYFSDANYPRDSYLQSLVIDGVVPFAKLLDFPRLRGVEVSTLRQAASGSKVIAVSGEGVVRVARRCAAVVVDANVLIRGGLTWLSSVPVYTTPAVIAEIRDEESRRRLAALPFAVAAREPSPEAIARVRAFARETGDARSLSNQDVGIIALTYDLEAKESGTTAHLRALHADNRRTASRPIRVDEPALAEGEEEPASEEEEEEDDDDDEEQAEASEEEPDGEPGVDDDTLAPCDDTCDDDEPRRATAENAIPSRILSGANVSGVSTGDSREDDGVGWVGPGVEDSCRPELEESVCAAACATSDFAMQNVLVQMGLRLVSVDGRRIERTRRFVVRCAACFALETKDLERLFCGRCGSDALRKVGVAADGTVRPPRVSTRRCQGTKFALPKPKAYRAPKSSVDRFQGDLLLREDQLFSGIWRQKHDRHKAHHKAVAKTSVFGPDVADALVDLDLHAAPKLTVGYGRKNPNATKGRERRGKKKKK
ncbi:hypothetical protein CTAYLR_001938 [Chrysophaeum taylorii]|uniref:HTH La-type RNA-binding domain-containing protein n=1 Tax=Chrysophaeum taylorii TaxID=2483200 RepID=A0AAD7U995_9STRA|nr:hypothetical protein CTAYLR_001938 [Chrysophaeum taylorii]